MMTMNKMITKEMRFEELSKVSGGNALAADAVTQYKIACTCCNTYITTEDKSEAIAWMDEHYNMGHGSAVMTYIWLNDQWAWVSSF